MRKSAAWLAVLHSSGTGAPLQDLDFGAMVSRMATAEGSALLFRAGDDRPAVTR